MVIVVLFIAMLPVHKIFAYINSYIQCILLDYNMTISAFQLTQKDTGRSLKMTYECRNL
jgi:hypothetical protein